MPKRYRIEMTLIDEGSNTQLVTDTHKETYKDDAQAKERFETKEKAARETGKGSR